MQRRKYKDGTLLEGKVMSEIRFRLLVPCIFLLAGFLACTFDSIADTITVDGELFEDVYITESSTAYVVCVPKDGSTKRYSKSDATNIEVHFTEDAEKRREIYNRWKNQKATAVEKEEAERQAASEALNRRLQEEDRRRAAIEAEKERRELEAEKAVTAARPEQPKDDSAKQIGKPSTHPASSIRPESEVPVNIDSNPRDSGRSGSGGAESLAALMFLGVTGLLYFLPALIAFSRKHHNSFAIFVLNFLLGWTCLGYVFALVWSFTNVPVVGVVPAAPMDRWRATAPPPALPDRTRDHL